MVECDKLYHNNQDENVQELYTFDPGGLKGEINLAAGSLQSRDWW